MPISLSLKNFRCWEDQTFHFNDNGIILLSGISGKGKSTLLNAFLYVITGNMKNVTMFGKEKLKSEVILTLQDENECITITRAKNPTRFHVKKGSVLAENDVAQHIINDLFGTDFKHISYIDQDNDYSFVYMSAENKMSFLRTLLLSQEPVEEFKEEAKTRLDTNKKHIIAEDSKITTSMSFLSTMIYDNEHTSKPYKLQGKRTITLSNYQETIDIQQTNLDKSKKNKQILVSKLLKLEDEQKLFYEQTKLCDKINDLEQQLNKYNSISDMKDTLTTLLNQKEEYENNKRFHEEKKKYIEIKVL